MIKQSLIAALMTISTIALAQSEMLEKADKNFQLANFAEAARAYEKILTTLDDTSGITERLADCYFHLGQFGLAESWYIKALEKTQTSVDAIFRTGETFKINGKLADATQLWESYANFNRKKSAHFLSSVAFAKTGLESTAYVVSPSQYSTPAADFGASVLRGGVVFASSRTDLKRKNGTNKNIDGTIGNQLFTAPLESGASAADNVQFLKNDFKNTLNEAPAAYSGNGKWVAFSRNNFHEDIRPLSTSGLEMSLYIAKINDKGDWTDIKPFPHNISGYATGFPALNEDGSVLYFTSNRPQGKGGFDIWVSTRKNDSWTKPLNVEMVNTLGDEITPFWDGKSLFFASDYHIGFGGFDIFKTEQNQDGTWATIQNLGKGINSSADDYNFVMSKSKIGYLTSNRKGGKGKTDLYKITQKSNIITLQVQNEATKTSISLTPTEIKLLGTKGVLSTLKDGSWAVAFEDDATIKISIQKQGFENQIVNLNSSMGSPVSILLKKENSKPTIAPVTEGGYVGFVKDSSTGQPLANATVRAMHQKSSTMLETRTDAQGKYVLPLEKNTSYVLSYSKEKFLNLNRNFKTGVATKGNIGDITMQHSATSPVKPQPKPLTPPTPQPKPLTPPTPRADGWAIQLLVEASSKKVDLTPFKDIRSLGNFYTSVEGNKTKVRMGVYKTRTEAEAVLKALNKKGYKTAYIVEEINIDAINDNIFVRKGNILIDPNKEDKKDKKDDEKKEPKKDTLKPYNKVVVPPTPKQEVVSKSLYKVRVASLSRPEQFDKSKLASFGEVLLAKQGKWTLVLIDGFKSIEEARKMRLRLKEAGHKDARVVLLGDDGVFKEVD